MSVDPQEPLQREPWAWQLVMTAEGATLDHCCPNTSRMVRLQWLDGQRAWACPQCCTTVSVEVIGALDPSQSRGSRS